MFSPPWWSNHHQKAQHESRGQGRARQGDDCEVTLKTGLDFSFQQFLLSSKHCTITVINSSRQAQYVLNVLNMHTHRKVLREEMWYDRSRSTIQEFWDPGLSTPCPYLLVTGQETKTKNRSSMNIVNSG